MTSIDRLKDRQQPAGSTMPSRLNFRFAKATLRTVGHDLVF
ncbi:MAG: hypothetical protein ACK4TB_07645 [Gemmobacter sp.]